MNDQVIITLRLSRSTVKKLEGKARNAGLSLEEYILELTLRDLDPLDRVYRSLKKFTKTI